MRYGVTLRMSDGPFAGCRLAILWTYGFPLLFDEYEEAAWYVQTYCDHRPDDYQPQVVPESRAMALVKQLVETYSGRRKVSSGNMMVVDETKATYERCIQIALTECDVRYRGQVHDRMVLYREALLKKMKPKEPKPEMVD